MSNNLKWVKALTDFVAGIMYKHSTDEADEGKWIEGKDYHKVAALILEALRPRNFDELRERFLKEYDGMDNSSTIINDIFDELAALEEGRDLGVASNSNSGSASLASHTSTETRK